MALVKCRECGKEISSEARSCPNCGATQKKKAGLLKKVVLGTLGVIVVLGVIGSFADKQGGSAKSPVAGTPYTPASPYAFETTPSELATAYEENTVAADGRFKGKNFKVSGTVESINTGIGDGIYITMRGSNQFMHPQFAIKDSERNAAAALKKGQKATLICTGGGDIAKIPMSRNCVFM